MSERAARSPTGLPVVAVLVPHWESTSEEGWVTRQVAGALACAGDVHIITPDGRSAGASVDGAFTLHRLGTPLDAVAELRRALLIEGLSLSAEPMGTSSRAELATLLDQGVIDPWLGATGVLNSLRPDVIVVAGHQSIGALRAADRGLPGTPIALLALGSERHSVAFPHFKVMFDRAEAILAVTEGERRSVIEHHGRMAAVHRIGAPMAANPSALTEPNGWVGSDDYILVVTGSASDEDHVETDLSRLIRLRFPDTPVGISHTDSFSVWRKGQLHEGWAVERPSDMARLMAWARVTVDLHPGPLFARRCVDSLLFGTPIVVPHDSLAREHAERGRGGLWFANASELTWCIDALLDDPTRDAFGRQGRAYAEDEYGSTDRFIDRVVDACGLTTDAEQTPASV